jgi:hypothetical protein
MHLRWNLDQHSASLPRSWIPLPPQFSSNSSPASSLPNAYPTTKPPPREITVTSLEFKLFDCTLNVDIIFESNQILKIPFQFDSNSKLRAVFEVSFKFCCDPIKVVNMKVAPNIPIYLLSKFHIL